MSEPSIPKGEKERMSKCPICEKIAELCWNCSQNQLEDDKQRLDKLKEWLIAEKCSIRKGDADFSDGMLFAFTCVFDRLYREEQA